MKKNVSLMVAMILAVAVVQARPVTIETARNLAQSFVRANFEFTRQSSDLQLVKTAYSDRGEACYYIFNVGETGFVILAADDCVRPIIGYSYESTFNVDDMAPALADHLENVRLGISEMVSQYGTGSAEAAADWAMLERCGRLVSRHGGREDKYLCETTWNQNYPYNYYCPSAPSGPGGRVYAGCVATAAAQVMRYWNHPAQGQGSHSYTPSDHPEYGVQYANFGETTYDWANMPNSINSSSPMVQIQAVALLLYHVGVSVNMNYSPSGSGAATNNLTNRMPLYFDYTPNMDICERDKLTHQEYMNTLINSIDMGWPLVHAGGGHAYVCDGYNDFDQVHMNWGWGGSSDSWFDIDTHGYTDGQRAIINCVPKDVYAATPDAPTDVVAMAAEDHSLKASITWKNPTTSLTGVALETIDRVVVTRGGQTVFEAENVAPGEEMVFVDETVPYYDAYEYAVFAVADGKRGKTAMSGKVLVGPSCDWKIVMQTSAFQGWNGGYVALNSVSSGTEITRLALYNSQPASIDFAVPLGKVSFSWSAPKQSVNNITFIIKDADGNAVYTYSGNTNGLQPGVFHTANNDCGSGMTTATPINLQAETEDGKAVLHWETESQPLYGVNVFRDEQLYALVKEGNTFVDEGFANGHCYTVTALDEGGESEHSNETCASAGDCMGATDFDYEYTGNLYKIKLSWTKPEPHDGLSGYYLYRKRGEDDTYERVKLLGASATSYTDNQANVEGDYYYRLYAYYSQTDCTSSPASIKGNPNQFYLRVYYSPTDVEESCQAQVSVYPNPADQSLRIEAQGISGLTVCNMLGQVVLRQECQGSVAQVETSSLPDGLYMLTVQTEQGKVSRKFSVVH